MITTLAMIKGTTKKVVAAVTMMIMMKKKMMMMIMINDDDVGDDKCDAMRLHGSLLSRRQSILHPQKSRI
jgi:hypothetical protein